jgi:hypothetical protein
LKNGYKHLRDLTIDLGATSARILALVGSKGCAGVGYHLPFGGRKGPSDGPREQGRYAAKVYTTVKTAYASADLRRAP